MKLKETERLLEVEERIKGEIKRQILNIMKEIEVEFEKIRNEEKINIDLIYDKYDDIMFELKIEGILEKWRLTKQSDKKIIWQRVRFLLEHSIYSDKYRILTKKMIFEERDREELKIIINYMKDAYAILRFILSRL